MTRAFLTGRFASDWRWFAVSLALLGLGAGCQRSEAPAEPEPGLPVPDIAYGDCETVLAGPVCVLPEPRVVRLSVRAAGGNVEFQQQSAAGWQPLAPLPSDDTPDLYFLSVDADTEALRVRVDGAPVFHLAVANETAPDDLAATRAELDAADRSGLDNAVAQLESRLANPDLARRGATLALLARGYQRLGRSDDAARALAASIDVHLANGRPLDALRTTNVLVNVLYYKEARYDEVGALYARIDLPQPAPAEASFFASYNRGTAALESGDSRAAFAELQSAARLARRMGWARRALDADQSLALHLMQIGRRKEARDMLLSWRERGLPDALRPCERAAFDVNLAWLALLQLEAGERVADPTATLRRLRDDVDEHCLTIDRVNARINLALAHYHAGRYRQAQAVLGEARALTDSPGAILRLWALDIDARAALGLGDLDAASALFDELAALAQITLSQDGRWRAAVGAARVSRAAGLPQQALREFQAADRLLREDLLRLPVDAGRDSLLASRQRVRQEQMSLLLELRRIDDALLLALRHNGEVLATLGPSLEPSRSGASADALRRYRLARRDLQSQVARSWTLPRDQKLRLLEQSRLAETELMALLDRGLTAAARRVAAPPRAAPQEGVVELVFFDGEDGWATFVRDAAGSEVALSSCASDGVAALAACLLEPVAPHLAGARRVRLFPNGTLWSADFHALVVDRDAGLVLLDVADVEYALGLAPRAVASPDVALVVADARGDLPHAREELAIVRSALGAHGRLSLTALAGRDAVSSAVSRVLAAAGLFHYAGHARVGGYGGWQSELALASDTSMTVADVLALDAVPHSVVLSGCETAAAASATAASIGLGQAFLVRGATQVVAAVRDVDDRTTLALMREFYARWTPGADVSAALRGAQLALRAQQPDADWAAFRVIKR